MIINRHATVVSQTTSSPTRTTWSPAEKAWPWCDLHRRLESKRGLRYAHDGFYTQTPPRLTLHRSLLGPRSSGDVIAALCDVTDGVSGRAGHVTTPYRPLTLVAFLPASDRSVLLVTSMRIKFCSSPHLRLLFVRIFYLRYSPVTLNTVSWASSKPVVCRMYIAMLCKVIIPFVLLISYGSSVGELKHTGWPKKVSHSQMIKKSY